MNFIVHLKTWMNKLQEDDRLTPFHVSLYLALFRAWNLHRFRNPVSICREEVMTIAKIGSAKTYLKCMRNLHDWGYIRYLPSFNPHRGSKVSLYSFDPSCDKGSDQGADRGGTKQIPPLVNSINKSDSINSESIPPLQVQVIEFFLLKSSNKAEALKFFHYYQSNGWQVGGRTPMKNWKAAAEKWILSTSNYRNHGKQPVNFTTADGKDYSEPL
jgi:hypothetical protein